MQIKEIRNEIQEIVNRQVMAGNTTLKLIRDLPFIAGCRDPERVSMAHCALYVLTMPNGTVFDRTHEDMADPLRRLACVDVRKHNPEHQGAAEKGMAVLAMVMYAAYWKKNKISDAEMAEAQEKLQPALDIDSPGVDSILSVESALAAWWWPE